MQKDGEDRAAASVSLFQLPVNTTTLANYVRPPTHALSCADQPQYGSLFPMKGRAAHEFSQTPLLPHLPPFTVFPANANRINPRALAQSNRYATTQLKAQETKDIAPGDVLKIGGGSVPQALDGSESGTNPAKQDLDAALTLTEVANINNPMSTALVTGIIPVNTVGESDADASTECSQKCPVTTCEYHDKGFSTKVERDKHTMTHFDSAIHCGLCIRSPQTFHNVEPYQDHLYNHHNAHIQHDAHIAKCYVCFKQVHVSRYAEHLDDCIVYAVEREAEGKCGRCPLPWCDHRLVEFSSK